MLATQGKEPFSKPGWIYEIKWDGYRIISSVQGGTVQLSSRNGISYNHKFPQLVSELGTIPHNVVLDGEVVALTASGLPDFQGLQNFDVDSGSLHLVYYVFDLLNLNGMSTIGLPLTDRKSLLPEILDGLSQVRRCEHVEGMGIAFYERAVEMGLEGIIAKRADSFYYPGVRSEDWVKIKAIESTEALICGYTLTPGTTQLASLILGQYRDGELQYIGNCGSGFTDTTKKELLDRMGPLRQEASPFEGTVSLRGRTPVWVLPKLVCEVTFSEWTKSGRLRHPVYKGLREDKVLVDLAPDSKSDRLLPSSKNSLLVDDRQVSFSNLEKIYWPGEGFTKYDLIDYYIAMGEYIMPYLLNRPQNLHRHPNGINSEGFYQKDVGTIELPDWVSVATLYSESTQREIDYLLCQNVATLLYLANLGCIEINPWNATVSNLENPTYGVVDIDPSPKNTFSEVIEVALLVKEVLDAYEISGHCKTSGKKGLHIYIPFQNRYTYNEVRDFIKLICVLVNARATNLTTLERSINKRNGKIYLDYLQNRHGQTLAAPYSVRPVAGAQVSAPLSWEEVGPSLSPSAFSIQTIVARVNSQGDLFSRVLTEENDIAAILDRIMDVS